MEEKITDAELTWLTIKWGPSPCMKLAFLEKEQGSEFTELERRAASIGAETIRKNHKELEDLLADQIQKEIDNEIIKTIIGDLPDGTPHKPESDQDN